MITLSLREIALITRGTLVNNTHIVINKIITDTRSMTQGCLFIALSGKHFDAHEFIDHAISRGAAALLVNKHLQVDVPQIIVNDTRIALGQLASFVRKQVKTRVVALTGSSGKTLVKEMTAAILRQCGKTIYTYNNMNNEIGVSLTLLRLTDMHQYAVIELGANQHGEIAWTSSLSCPESVLVNNLSAAHLEGFGSLVGVAKAKSEIFLGLPKNGTAIINLDSNDWMNWKLQLIHRRVWRFSNTANTQADFYATNVIVSLQNTNFNLHTPYGVLSITLSLLGRHNIANAIAASALALSVGATLDAIMYGLNTLKSVPGRLFPIMLDQNKLLIDDSYNANVGSMFAAVQTLSEMPGYRIMVTGDIAELGLETIEYHRKLGKFMRTAKIDKVLSVGILSQYISDASGIGEHFSNKVDLIVRIQSLLLTHQIVTVLVKGSRIAAMEQVVQILQEKIKC